MISTTLAKGQKQNRRRGVRLWAVAVWLIVWQLGAMALGTGDSFGISCFCSAAAFGAHPPLGFLGRHPVLLLAASPWAFWLACLAGTASGVLSSRFGPVRDLAAPLMGVIKSIPVASFVILVLIWVPSRNLSVVISFLMVTPIVYSNVLGASPAWTKS